MEDSESTKKNGKRKKIFTKIALVISWIFTGFLALLAVVVLVVGMMSMRQGKMFKLFNYSYSVVITESMYPTIEVNDTIIIKYVDFDALEVDDIIVFYNPSEEKNICHRIISIDENGKLITKGDNNLGPDTFRVDEEHYIGKVVKYGSFFGFGGLVINGKLVFFIIIIAIFSYVIISETLNIIKLIRKRNDEKHALEREVLKAVEELQRKQLLEEMKEELKKELEEEFKQKEEENK